MNKKNILITILTILLIITITSNITLAKIAQSEIKINTTTSTEKPIDPSQTKEITLEIQYKINYTILPQIAQWFFQKTRPGIWLLFEWNYVLNKNIPPATINLTITEKPEWCTANLQNQNLTIPINTEFQKNNTKITLNINQDAPALEKGEITIQASYKNEKWQIDPTSKQNKITFRPSYQPNITYETKTELEIPPLNETIIPINITNNGNGETKTQIQIEEKPENCNITLNQPEINTPKQNTNQIQLSVTPNKNFTNGTIKIKLTSKSNYPGEIDDQYLKEETTYLNINITNDGSLKKEDEPLIIPGFEIITLTLAVTLFTILIRKRKQ